MTPSRIQRFGGFLALCTLAGAAHAAGHHHAVDDAAILAPGQCEFEGWFERAPGNGRLLHAGLGCRVGPVELGAASEYAQPGGPSETGWELQIKWAREFAPGVSAGFAVTPSWQAHARPRRQGTTIAGLFTWQAADALAVHVNFGRDFVRGGPNLNRSGIAAEWTPSAGWTVIGERYAQEGSQFARAGLRRSLREDLSIDVSRAQRLSGPGTSSWTIGATWQFP